MDKSFASGSLLATLLFAVAFSSSAQEQPLKPDLKFPTLQAYEEEIKQEGVLFEGEHVLLFAPSRFEQSGRIIHDVLQKAYDEIFGIVGTHTRYKMVVYHFPKGSPNATGGTSECVIYYDDSNLDLSKSEEWTKYKAPHVSGYIEEMAHNFVSVTGAQFGWEMVGWSVGVQACEKVANNPIFAQHVLATRKKQEETFARYKANNCTFPSTIPANLCDRVHAYLLWQCHQKYGPDFWKDFFALVLEKQEQLAKASLLGTDDEKRNARYQITVDCFDRLPGVGFKKLLVTNGISLAVDVKSLHPTDPGWNRKLNETPSLPTDERTIEKIDPDTLSPLHKAAFGGEGDAVARLIEQGESVSEKGPYGWTPLHMAALGGHQSTAERLLEKGADACAKDEKGRTPARLAELRGHGRTADFLRKKEQKQ